MKVFELINLLKSIDPSCDVILQKDSEGNGFSPLEDVDSNCVYIPDSKYSGDIYSLSWSADDACMTQSKWDNINKMKRCVVLSPIN